MVNWGYTISNSHRYYDAKGWRATIIWVDPEPKWYLYTVHPTYSVQHDYVKEAEFPSLEEAKAMAELLINLGEVARGDAQNT